MCSSTSQLLDYPALFLLFAVHPCCLLAVLRGVWGATEQSFLLIVLIMLSTI